MHSEFLQIFKLTIERNFKIKELNTLFILLKNRINFNYMSKIIKTLLK